MVNENTEPYEINYRPYTSAGNGEWTTLTTSEKTHRVEGLTSNTEYEIRLRNIIGENTSAWTTTRTFTTQSGVAYGDVNCDDKISLADITAIANIIKGNTTGYNVDEADYNYDGVVDKDDIEELIDVLFYYFIR